MNLKFKTKLYDVINTLNEKGISQGQIAREINKIVNLEIDSAKISQYKYHHTSIPQDVIEAFHILYKVNPFYLKEESDRMFDETDEIFKALNTFVKDYKITLHSYQNENGKQIDKNFLHITIDKKLYNLLITYAHVNRIKENGNSNLWEEFKKNANEKYLASNKVWEEFVILPKNSLFDIADNEHTKCNKQLCDLINFEEIIPFFTDEADTPTKEET